MNTPVITHDIFYCKRFINSGGLYSPNSILSLGYTDETSNYTNAIQLKGSSKTISCLMPMDMNGWEIYNTSIGYKVIINRMAMSFKASRNFNTLARVEGERSIFDETKVVTPNTRRLNNFATFKNDEATVDSSVDDIGVLDVSNVTNKDEIMLDDENADLGKLVTILFKKVKEQDKTIKNLENMVNELVKAR